ncbi:MAG: ABC transporter ATP-binding protein, partial [Chitinivibrionia bacterium]|nr:ABC transporter ATP-binding protein [Chitinivibrionia bacterium]
NGAGKTTTIKLVLGLLKLETGRISIFGSTGATREARRRIGYLNEDVGLYPYLNADETLQLAGELFRIERPVLKVRKARLLDAVGLAEKARVKVKNYSKGMRQRLGVAVALINNPDLLLLDEPYTGLDPIGRKQLKDLFLSLKGEGKTVLLSSHIAPDVEAVCDRVGILKNGSIAKFLTVSELYEAGSGEVEVTASGISAGTLTSTVAGVREVYSGPDLVVVKCAGEAMLKMLISTIYSYDGAVLEVKPAKASLEECLVEALSGCVPESAGKPRAKKQSPEPMLLER